LVADIDPISVSQLFEEISAKEKIPQLPDTPITGIASDSRQVRAGDLFVAVPGGTFDGHRFIPDVIERGVAAIVGEQALSGIEVPYIQVSNSRRVLPQLAAAFYGYPARQMTVIGVTGTDGKTTTANLIFSILNAAQIKAGMISTVNAVIGDQVLDTGFHVTTPDPIDVQRFLTQMAAAGLTHVVLEATSHGLAQHRVDACEFDVGVVTNITHEHLDEHGSYEAYLAAKGRLFSSLVETQPKDFPVPRMAVLNRDDGSFGYLQSIVQVPYASYGFHPEADLRPEKVTQTPGGLRFIVAARSRKFDRKLKINTTLVGDFNVLNCLAAITTASNALGLEAEAIETGIANMTGIPGRMERIDLGQDFSAIVDFAHTPNALRSALLTARRIVDEAGEGGRVIAIFGSAGLRDREKRRMMAETSAELANYTILTAEDPRTEDLGDILAEMAAGVVARGGAEGHTFWRIADRGQAIRFGLSLARRGDIVLSCGKGHEQSMCFGTVEYPWDDRTAMQAALAEMLGKSGPKMPYLPTQDRKLGKK
jgi:UDP-N-acetylmuramoyl-L-alanyl-D-glutamate--2,6-diaminopimelate ligase